MSAVGAVGAPMSFAEQLELDNEAALSYTMAVKIAARLANPVLVSVPITTTWENRTGPGKIVDMPFKPIADPENTKKQYTHLIDVIKDHGEPFGKDFILKELGRGCPLKDISTKYSTLTTPPLLSNWACVDIKSDLGTSVLIAFSSHPI